MLPLLFISCSKRFNPDLDSNLIVWKSERKLTYSDFNKYNVPIEVLKFNTLGSVRAVTTSGIHTKVIQYYFGKIKYLAVRAVFLKDGSWFDKTDLSEYTLEHEQLHFDISEVFARKFKKHLLSKYNKPISHNQLDAEYKLYTKMLGEFEDKYDRETNFGTDETKQKDWNKRVSELLDELSEYEDSILVF